jgi:hypothetical protein
MNTETQLAALLCKYFPNFASWFNNLDESQTAGLLERWSINLGDTLPNEVNGYVKWLVQGRLRIGEAHQFDMLAVQCREVVIQIRPRVPQMNRYSVREHRPMDAAELLEWWGDERRLGGE